MELNFVEVLTKLDHYLSLNRNPTFDHYLRTTEHYLLITSSLPHQTAYHYEPTPTR